MPDPLPHPSPMDVWAEEYGPVPAGSQSCSLLLGLRDLYPCSQMPGKAEKRERTWCPCSGDNPNWMDWQRVSLSWLGLEGILLEVSLHRFSMPCRGVGMGSDGALFQTLGPKEGPKPGTTPADCTLLPEDRGERCLPRARLLSLYPGGCGGWSLQPALPCALVLELRTAQPRWGGLRPPLEPSHSGHTGCERWREKGLGLPPSHPLPRQPCCWRWTQERGELTVLVVGAPVESLGEVCREVAEVCWMERAFLTSTLLVLPWRPSGVPHLYQLLQPPLPK